VSASWHIGILLLWAEGALHLGALTWIAWVTLRHTGQDPFEVVGAYCMGVWVLLQVVAIGLVDSVAALLAASAAIATQIVLARVAEITAGRRTRSIGQDQRLLMAIVAAALSLGLFSWSTEHAPVFLPPFSARARWALPLVAGTIAVALAAAAFRRSSRVTLILGHRNKWAAEAWMARPWTLGSWTRLSCLFAWLIVVVVPVGSTGIVASSILEDSALALLIARVTGSRGPKVLLAIVLSIALARTVAGYFAFRYATPDTVDVVSVCVLAILLKSRTTRAPWRTSGAG